MIIQGKEGKQNGEVGLTLTCVLQAKYQPEKKDKRVKSSSCTIHTKLKPRKVIERIKESIEEGLLDAD